MELKERIKKEIDTIPEEFLPQIERYLDLIKGGRGSRKDVLRKVHLKGRFDDVNVRKIAYE